MSGVNRPRFKSSLYVQVVEPDTVLLVSENKCHLLTGPIYTQLAPLLQGEYTVPLMASLLAGKVPYAHLMHALNRLKAVGYIVDADDTIPIEQAAFWHSLNIDTQILAQQVQQKQVAVQVVGETNAQSLVAALESLNITLADDGDLRVVIADDYLQEELITINQHALAKKQPWLLTRLVGESIWIGPLFIPGETACWNCMASRIRINRPVEVFVLKQRVDQASPFKTARSALASTVTLGANIVATEIAKWFCRPEASPLLNQLVTLNTIKMEMQTHHVVRRPQCNMCGRPEDFRSDREPQPVNLRPSPKKQNPLPEQALAVYERQISPITGVITHLVDVLPMEGQGYSYLAAHGFGAAQDLKGLRRNLQGRSSGKGRTRTQAKLSAIGESVERYSGVFWNEGEITITGSYNDLADRAIYPNDVLLFSQSQFEHRVAWNAAQKSTYHYVPKPFDPGMELSWVPFWSLTHHRFKYYPALTSYYDHPDALKLQGSCDSNGCAAGPTFEDAVLKGFLELVERDCAAMWWYNRLRYPRVDIDSFEMPYVQELQAFYQGINRSLWVIDITADFGIPTFVAVSGRTDREVEDILIGLGISFDPNDALLGALSEINQFLSNVLQTNPDGSTQYYMDVEETVEWFKTAKIENHPYLVPDDNQPTKTLADYPYRGSDDTRAEVETCVRLAAELGLETFVLDQSRPDIGISVARVVVPGLRHFWRRLAPGRLYEVPIKMGWLDRALSEDELNPISMFF